MRPFARLDDVRLAKLVQKIQEEDMHGTDWMALRNFAEKQGAPPILLRAYAMSAMVMEEAALRWLLVVKEN